MGDVAVIVNPRSRKNRGRDGSFESLERAAQGRATLYVCDDPASLRDAAQRIARTAPVAVAISGGDGTGSMVLTALRDAFGERPLPSIAMLRGGTMNTVANGVGVPRGRPEALLAGLVANLATQAPLATVTRRTLDIGGRVGFLFGVGVIHGFLSEYYARGKPYPTPLTAVQTLSAAIGSAMIGGATIQRIGQRFAASLVIDGEAVDAHDFLAIGAGTSPELGLGFRPFHLSDAADDGFHLLGITCSAPKLAANLPRLYRGRGIAEGDGLDRLARDVRITADGDAPIRYMVDGDLDTAASPLCVSLGPRVHIVTSPPAS